MNGTAAAASKAQPNIGRNRIQPIAITTNENEVAIATQAKLTPSPMISRTIGIQDTEKKNRNLDENFLVCSSCKVLVKNLEGPDDLLWLETTVKPTYPELSKYLSS